MNYPEYDDKDIHVAEQVGNFEISEFSNFVSELLQDYYLDHPAEIGVAKFISAKGTRYLTPGQKTVLEIILNKYPQTDCKRCGNTIELFELLNSYSNGHYCSYCQWQIEKDD